MLDLPAPEGGPLELTIDSASAGSRLDRYLAQALPELSRTYIQQLIADLHILVNGRQTKASYIVQPGDTIRIVLPLASPVDMLAQDIALTIRYEDADVLVVDKPAGMVVHPAPGHPTGTLVNALLHHYPTIAISGDLRPGIVHRLDKDTSGLLVVAKNDRAKTALQAQQKQRGMLKIYQALVYGHPTPEEQLIDAPIDRHPTNRMRMAVVEGGRSARTHLRVIERLDLYALVEAQLETGRTHQIRVHCASIGNPVFGDQLYGPRKPREHLGLTRHFLHACVLGFTHPRSAEWIEVTSPLPPELQEVLEKLRRRTPQRPDGTFRFNGVVDDAEEEL